MVNNRYLFQLLCFAFCDSLFISQTHTCTPTQSHSHGLTSTNTLAEPSSGCYLQHSISRIFTVCPIAVMRVQTVSELQPGFNKPKVFLAPCQCQLYFFFICLYTFLILFCPLQSCDNRNKNNNIHFSILPKANTCWCRPFCLLIPPPSLPPVQ